MMKEFVAGVISFFSTSQLLLGFLVCLGLILERESFSKILVGTSRTILGLTILNAGAGLLVGVLANLTPLISMSMGGRTFMPVTETVVIGAMGIMAATISGVFVGAFLVNLLIARITRWKYVMLSGLHMIFISSLLPLVVAPAGLVGIPSVIVCSIIGGIMYTYMPAITQRFTKIITGDQPVSVGHPGATGYALSAWLGSKLGDPSKSTEDLKISDKWDFLNDYAVIAAIVMFVLFLACTLVIGPSVMETTLKTSQNWIAFSLLQAFTFASGIMLVLYGVRIMLAEIVPAFHGIAEKLIPNAIPALDCPIMFSFAPNAVIIGFIASMVGGVFATVAIKLAAGFFVIPPITEHFFMGGTAAIYGNATGGRKGAVIGAVIMGIGLTALPLLLWQFTKVGVPQPVGMVDTDLVLWGSATGAIARLIHSIFVH